MASSQIFENVGEPKIGFLYFIVSTLQKSNTINSHILSSCKLFLDLLIHTLSGEALFLLADKRNSILFNMYSLFFLFVSWALHSVKTDIHCTAKCTCKYVLLDTNRQRTLRRYYCVWTMKFEHIKE